jgi:nucleoid DNA-binding protein
MPATEKKLKAIKDKQTQTQIIASISTDTGLSNKDVKAVLMQLGEISHRHIMKRGSGEFKVPFMGIKINRKVKPATKKRMGRNPATGEEMVIAAKPKREVVKAMPLKAIKTLLEKDKK